MVHSTLTHSIDLDKRGFPGLRIVQLVLILIGLALVVFSALLFLMGTATAGGPGAVFKSGYVRILTPFITNVSMASSFVVLVVILTFEKSKANAASVLFGVLTLLVFCAEISLSLYLSVGRPLTSASPLMAIYLLIGLVPLGLGCTMFTLASIVDAQWGRHRI